ncbi:hypothetical protein LTR37_015177 [Vermiconidia calcicola]|uniref:Uncharacterized protein n=1 Tax=Vermiconidia calcicola TaxID=1690605 RepID=A0ACC3MRB0_9PEZI|nr:hypothetical protein LTR37_015177 [Vermiconidia calcicola]
MEAAVQGKQSRIPLHLRPFLRSSLTAEPLVTQTPYSYTLPYRTSPAFDVELCPPHWRLLPKRSLKEKLTNILLKDWQSYSPPRTSSPPQRPVIMRMKDSDDYITARAANPRTGLISPSIGGRTPDTPGAALQQAARDDPPSPTPEVHARPTLRRANEGRKVSGGTAAKSRVEGIGWLMDGAATVASPKVSTEKAGAGLVFPKMRPPLSEDAFVVNMPSAQEPQPYAYPGYSAKQIAAFQHYKRKARRVSSEGYDHRLLNAARQLPSGSTECGNGARNLPPEPLCAQSVSEIRLPQTSDCKSAKMPAKNNIVAKRGARARDRGPEGDALYCVGGAEASGATFAPFSSPKTPTCHSSADTVTAVKTLPSATEHQAAVVKRVHRKPVASLQGRAIATNIHSSQNCDDHSTEKPSFHASTPKHPPTDLRDLPRIDLKHPSIASKPQAHPQRHPHQRSETRKCSFGCVRDADSDVCLERRLVPVDNTSSIPSLFHDVHASTTAGSVTEPGSLRDKQQVKSHQVLEILVTVLVGIVDGCKHLNLPALPRPGVLNDLTAEETTPQQKINALRTILSSTGQAIAVVVITAALWQVGSLVLRVLEIILWPILAPFRILRWLSGSG